ncbi:MAG TPA: flagellar biosynthesis anti-sigma factor FlgM [Desulforhopalus sp.]|jgi:negative regulator of flagellin synthesis FlgM|nr:flagellar biosynthesis anti-sigma factor FlgM [Desulforhopalus sp.]
MSVEFFGVGGPGQIGALKQSAKAQNGKKAEGSGEDKVQFSSVLQEVNRAKAAESSSSARAERVAQIQAQIKEGSYQPDLKKVSASLLQFLVEGK